MIIYFAFSDVSAKTPNSDDVNYRRMKGIKKRRRDIVEKKTGHSSRVVVVDEGEGLVT